MAMMPTELVVAVFAKATRAEPERSGERRTRSGTRGSATLRSTRRKVASRNRAKDKAASVRGEPKPASSVRVRPYTSRNSPAVTVTAPHRGGGGPTPQENPPRRDRHRSPHVEPARRSLPTARPEQDAGERDAQL